MSKPERDLADIAGSLKRMHGAAVPQHMRGHVLCGDRGCQAFGGRHMLPEPVGEPVPCHLATITVQEQFGPHIAWPDSQPRANGGLGLLPERQDALPPPLAQDPNAGQRNFGKIVHSHREQFDALNPAA